MTAQTSTNEIHLTPNEKLVTEALFDTTLSNELISQLLRITLASVKFHSHNIYTKFKVENRMQLKALDRKFVIGLIR